MGKELTIEVDFAVKANGKKRAWKKFNASGFIIVEVYHKYNKTYGGESSYTFNADEITELGITDENIDTLEISNKINDFLKSKIQHQDVFISHIEPNLEISYFSN